MAKLSANFNWKSSPGHLDLLSKFVKPRDVAQVLDWQYLKETIHENAKDAIDRLIEDGALNPCGIEESAERVLTAAQLKRMLKDLGLKQTGAKEELVARLVTADRAGVERVISRTQVVKCSAIGLALVERYNKDKQSDLDHAKQQSFAALLRSAPKEAYKIHVAYARKYASLDFASNSPDVDWLECILSSQPAVLGDVTPNDLKNLQAAACMTQLWHGELATNWLPEGTNTRLKSNQVAVNYLIRHADFSRQIKSAGDYDQRLKIVFESNDIDSCDLCLALSGQEFDKDKFPELPFVDCTSETGCMCRVESVYEHRDSDVFEIIIGDEDFEDDGGDPVSKLRQLKEMLDEDLITQDEYTAKKAEILSRM